MNNSKKIAVLLAALMAVSMTACGNSGNNEEETKTTTTTAAVVESEVTEESEAEDESKAEDAPAEDSADVTAAEDIQFDAASFTKDELKTAKLTEVASFSAKGLEFYGDFIYSPEDEEHITCYSYKGEKLGDGNIMQVNKLGETGLYSYDIVKDDMIYEGLMDAEGNIIQSADNGVGLYSEISDRFLMAFFPEGETTNEDEAIYYVTANQFSFQPKDEDTLYKGKIKIYDVVNNKYLENTTTSTNTSYMPKGDIVRFSDKDNNTVYVNADDKVLDLGYDYNLVGDDFLVKSENDVTTVYNHELEPMFTTKYMVNEFAFTTDFFQLTDTESKKKGIMYKNGAIVLEPKYGNIEYVGNGFFAYSNGDIGSKVGLLGLDGTEITKEDYKNIRYFDVPGFFNAAKDDKTDIIDETGKVIVADQDSGFSAEYAYVKDGDDYVNMVWSKAKPELNFGSSGTSLGHNMLYSSKEKTIYDQVTGEKLMEDAEKAYISYGYLVVLNGDDATVYSVE